MQKLIPVFLLVGEAKAAGYAALQTLRAYRARWRPGGAFGVRGIPVLYDFPCGSDCGSTCKMLELCLKPRP